MVRGSSQTVTASLLLALLPKKHELGLWSGLFSKGSVDVYPVENLILST